MDWDKYNQKIYNKNYSETNITHNFQCDYNQEMISLRFKILNKYCKNKKVADFGCGTGSYLIPLSKITKEITGIDFSKNMLNILKSKIKNKNYNNIKIYQGNIKNTSLESGSFDVVFSIATLYYIPEVEKVILEMNRVLKKGGIAIFEMGNLWSLNTLVVRKAPTGVKSFHISPAKMERVIKQAKFKILECKYFQLFPMCSGPLYLKLLANSKWKMILGKKIRGGMLDEIISSFPLFKHFAFRYLFICQKEKDL